MAVIKVTFLACILLATLSNALEVSDPQNDGYILHTEMDTQTGVSRKEMLPPGSNSRQPAGTWADRLPCEEKSYFLTQFSVMPS